MTIKTRSDLNTAIATIDDGGANTAAEVRSVLTDIMDSGTNVSSGAGAPATTPSRVGDIYIDTTADVFYIATGVASSADWDAITVTTHTHTESDITDLGNYQVVLSEGAFVDGDKTKLDTVESGADVTDSVNVAAAGGVLSDPTGVTGADAITNIISLTQAEYDAITPDASTFYVITS